MKAIAAYSMRGPWPATAVAGLLGALSWIVPPLACLSGATIGLVSLRLGYRAGFQVCLFASIFLFAVAWGGLGSLVPALALIAGSWLPVVAAAQFLRLTSAQGPALMAIGGLGMGFALLLRLLTGDVQAWWRDWIVKVVEQAMGKAADLPAGAIEQIAAFMNGMVASGLIVNVVIALLIGRWWQALLYNPGGFKQEFLALRLPPPLTAAVLVGALVSFLAGISAGISGLVIDFVIVTTVLHVFQGIALVHHYRERGGSIATVVIMYAGLMFLLPYVAGLLSALGFLDAAVDFRRRGRAASSASDLNEKTR